MARGRLPALQELVAFEAAARHGSFTRAADELALTQSAISKQIRALEERLGVALFTRATGRVALTTAGDQYLRPVRNILDQCETSTHAVMASAGSQALLKLAVLPTFGSRWLIPRMARFLEPRPGVSFQIVSRAEPFDLAGSGLDAAIHYGGPAWPDGQTHKLFEDTIIAVAAPRYLKELQIGGPQDLLGATLLQQASRPNLWRTWFEAAGVFHPQPFRGPVFDQFSMTSQAAAAGLGVALTPKFLVERELAERALVALDIAPLSGPEAYYVVTPLRKAHDGLVAEFVTWILDEAADARS